MPGADSCAVMEGENEGDVEDEVVYTKPSLLGKLKAIASKVRADGVWVQRERERETEKIQCRCVFIAPKIALDLNVAVITL